MQRMMMVACFVAIAVVGASTALCFLTSLWPKIKGVALWGMPKVRIAAFAGIAAAATVLAQKGHGLGPDTLPKLVYRSTLDSVDAITSPLVGGNGTCCGATFVDGKFASALHVPAGTCVASIPLPQGLPRDRGCIEFWARLEGNKLTFSDGGDPMFLYFSRTDTAQHFGWIEFNLNNGVGRGGLGANMGSVGLYTDNCFSAGAYSAILSDKVADWHHYALLWNVDGIWSLNDNPRFALLLDGRLVAQSNGDNNWDKDTFVASMAVPLRLDLSHSGIDLGKSAYSIDELRVWDSDDVIYFSYWSYSEETGVRYVDANAPAGGLGLDWNTAARTIDEVSRNMNGGAIYVKPGVYGAFSYHEVTTGAEPLRIVAMGGAGDTVIDGAGSSGIVSLEANLPHEAAPSPETPMLRLEGFTVRNMNVRACEQEFDRCIVSNYTQGAAYSSAFRNCLIVANESTAPASLFDGCIFDDCTITGNRTTSNSAVNSVARNSIFWNNPGCTFYCLYATNCCVEGGAWAGENNISEYPLFVNAEAGNYRLANGSPCIDAGYDSLARGEYDLEGRSRILGEHVDIGAYESLPPPAPARLVYHNTLDSADAVEHPAVGSPGTCTSATFVNGKIGAALYVPAGTCAVRLPLPDGLPANSGCIEFWAKLGTNKVRYGDGGDPMFIHISPVDSLDHFCWIEFNSNNGGGKGGLGAILNGFGIYPDPYLGSKTYADYLSAEKVGDWHHYALVWNVDGIISLDGNPNVALLLDGKTIVQESGSRIWDKGNFMAGLSQPLVIGLSYPDLTCGKSPYFIDDLKIWDSDKTSFRFFASHQDVSYDYDGTAHALQPATGGVGDDVFRYSLSADGPFVEEMPTLTDAGSICVWYQVEAEGESIVSSAMLTVNKRPLYFTSASAEKPYDERPLFATNIVVTSEVPAGEGFSFSGFESRTAVGESDNTFTWTANEGTNPDNYDITVVFGKLKVTMGAVEDGIAYELVRTESGDDAVRITRLSYPEGGDVTLPKTLGGVPVTEIVAGALAGTGVTGVRVPAGVSVAGSLFENLAQLTNITFDAGSMVTDALSFRGSELLREVVLPASVRALEPHAFLGCWSLERVVFADEPPFGNNDVDRPTAINLVTSSVRPASLLQMADMICYPVNCAEKWEKSLRNLGYGGKYGAYTGEWAGEESLVAGSGNLAAPLPAVVTNVIVSVVTNVLVPAVPAEQPSPQYSAQAGAACGTVLAGTAGWDMFGLPDGMTWDRDTGTLGGTPTRSGTYDLILVSGSGAETKMMRTTIDVAGYAVTTGYVGVAFKASGTPWDALASYKTAPAGLKWKSKVLSGVPTKAGTTTYKTKAGEPVRISILALPDAAKGTYNGMMLDVAGKQYPLKVAATAAGKLTATVTKGTKTYSLSAAKWSKVTVENVDGAPHRMFSATLTASGMSLSVKVDVDAAWNSDALTAVGTLGAVKNLAGSAQRNAYAANDEAKAVATALASTYALTATSDGSGGWVLDLTPVGVKGTLTAVLKATGAATLSGTLPNKTKVNASSTLHVNADGIAMLRFCVKGVWIAWNPVAH